MEIREMIEANAKSLRSDAEVVDYKTTGATDGRTIYGVCFWKHSNEGGADGFEYVTHQFYIRHGEEEAFFEVGHYWFNKEEAERDWQIRKERGY